MVPELSCNKLGGVKDGTMAMEAYGKAVRPGTGVERRVEIERQLHAYCRLDTSAMVRLWQYFSGRQEALQVDH